MHQASVGFHCPECARTGSTNVHRGIPTEVPWLTYVLMGISIAVFIVDLAIGGSDLLRGGLSRTDIDFGLIARGWDGSGLVGVGEGEWYRLVTSGFLHSGIVHLGFNMYLLYLLGRLLEPSGQLRMGLIYTASLVAGSFGALLLSPSALTVGASGAIFGLMGAVFMGHRSMGVDWRNSPLLNLIILNLVFTFVLSRSISVGGHVGGLIGGVLAGWLAFDIGRRPGVPTWLAPTLTVVLTLACGIGAVLFANSWTG